MSDLISRQAAIEAFYCADELIVDGEANARNVVNYINKVVGKIENLPSAQPELSAEDRQLIKKLRSYHNGSYANVIDKLIPSAQPEIIRCKDCKHHNYDSKGITYCNRIDYGYGWKEDDFCSRGERREVTND